MSWADNYIRDLSSGKTVKFRPVGNSMSDLIESGQLVTVEPISPTELIKLGDIVLCTVREKQYLHLVKEIMQHPFLVSEAYPTLFKIGNNKGKVNGWIKNDVIYGKVVKIEK